MTVKEKAKTVPAKDAETAGAEKVNNRLINPTGINQNVDEKTEGGGEPEKGDKNKKTTEGKIAGKEKAKNARKSSLEPKDSDPDKSDPKSNRDEPKAKKRDRDQNEDNGKDKPKKKDKQSS